MQLLSILDEAKKHGVTALKVLTLAIMLFIVGMVFVHYGTEIVAEKKKIVQTVAPPKPQMVEVKFTSIGITHIGGCVMGYYVIPEVGQMFDKQGRVVTCEQATITLEKYKALLKSWHKRESV